MAFQGVPVRILGRSLLLQAVGAMVAAGGAAYYLTHPRRVTAVLPTDLAEDAADVFLIAADGARVHGTWLPGRTGPQGVPSDRTIIHQHGFGSCGGVVLARTVTLRRSTCEILEGEADGVLWAWPLVRAGLARGYSFLLLDMRAHGRSEGPWDVSGGRAADDLAQWVAWLRQACGQGRVGLWGQSFGASVGLVLAVRADRSAPDAMVLDSPAVSARGLYSGVLCKPVYWAVRPVFQQLANRSLVPSVLHARHLAPTLLIHGQEDRHVPLWQGEHLHGLLAAAGASLDDAVCEQRGAVRAEVRMTGPGRGCCEFWPVPGADHLEALEQATEEYVSRTLDWFDRWL